MSRGDRVAVDGNISSSMRNNYGEHGVKEYYEKVGSTYRNPHYPGIRRCLFFWLNKWWQMEQLNIKKMAPAHIMLFDMACGSGEVTLAFVEWCSSGKRLYRDQESSQTLPTSSRTPGPLRKGLIASTALGPEFPKPRIAAADPYTAVAFRERTTYPCANLSFEAIAEGELPEVAVNIADGSLLPTTSLERTSDQPEKNEEKEALCQIEMVVCSFALHLIESPSSLFALLWQLSLKARWLVIISPHKKPEIKNGWGWRKWDVNTWEECEMLHSDGEILHERVHCRIFRSANF